MNLKPQRIMNKLFIIIFVCFGFQVFSQTEISITRKIQRFENTQRDILKISESQKEYQDSILLFVDLKRKDLAPNCPYKVTNSPKEINRNQILENWILNFPLEYKNYVEFLEIYIRQQI